MDTNIVASYGHVILFSLLGGVVSLLGGVLLLSKKRVADSLGTYATPFAAGALLAAVFLDLLPEGLEVAATDQVLLATLGGILMFFVAERFLHWFHHHDFRAQEKVKPNTSLIIIGDTVHNLIDGIAIGAAFLISVPVGIVTTFAVAAHEIPQEIGDFGLLLSKGMRRRSVLIVNVLSALAALVGAVVTFYLGSEDQLPTGILLGLSAGFLLYIALSDVIPSIHQHAKQTLLDSRPLLLLAGVLVVGLAIQIAHGYVGRGAHEDNHSAEQGLVIECNGRQVALDPYGGTTTNFLIAPDCDALEECNEEVTTIEGAPINAPCLENHEEHGAEPIH